MAPDIMRRGERGKREPSNKLSDKWKGKGVDPLLLQQSCKKGGPAFPTEERGRGPQLEGKKEKERLF